MTVRVAVAGASGRLGGVVCEVVEALDGFELTGRLGSASRQDEFAYCDILVDVTTPEVSAGLVADAVRRGQRVLVGTSGWSEDKIAGLAKQLAGGADPAARVLIVPNFSLASQLATLFAKLAAPYFQTAEIIESHHAGKIDSPSGTAVRTAELIGQAATFTPPFAEQRARGEQHGGVQIHSLRSAGVVAQQEVRFGGIGESLEIVHRTQSADSYRAGLAAALEWLASTDEPLTVGLERVLGFKL